MKKRDSKPISESTERIETSLSDILKITDESLRVSAIYDIFHEEDRLVRSKSTRVEFLTTIHYIEKVLKPGDKILDLGAGTGIYSLYFAEQGYSVTAVELANRNVEIFRSKITNEMDIRLLHENALDLSALEDNEFDIVLLFGPLYHLEKAEDRETCLQEARRVLKDSGSIYVSYINHDMIPFTESANDPLWLNSDSYDHDTFRLQNFPFVFFKIEECREMLVENGFKLEKEIASDGMSELLADTVNQMDERAYNQYLRYHMQICEKKEFLGASNHFLFVARKNIPCAISYPEDKDVKAEIADYLTWSCFFEGFIQLPELRSDNLQLVCTEKVPGNVSRNWVPSYHFAIKLAEVPIGFIDLRIGYSESLYYGGNIGYTIDEAYRGNSYAGKACSLLATVAKAHGMKKLIISNDYSNNASRRVCEKLGAHYLRTVQLPDWHDMRKDGHLYENIFVWDIDEL